ncbi:hypothetical protein, partial [Waltera sp.]|uniref:hypothetical protein n=1 Tax=Waltera sp. TaxID=2815806 RepID=UPI003AF1CB90
GSKPHGHGSSCHPWQRPPVANVLFAPPCFSTLFEKISPPPDKHPRKDVPSAMGILHFGKLKKTVAPAGYKNKQCRKQTSVLSGRTVTAYVPLRSATERERAAFLIPCQGLRGYFAKFQFTCLVQLFMLQSSDNLQKYEIINNIYL